MTLHTVILRENRIQHIMPASAYSNLFGVKDTDKTFKVFLKSRKWIDDQIEAEATFEREHMLASLKTNEQRVYEAVRNKPATKAGIQRQTGLSYHLVRNTIADLTTRNLIEKAGDYQWVAKP
jgi:predicted HTH transcriptional regulator